MINVTDAIKKAYDVSTTQVDKVIMNGQEYRILNVEYYDDVYSEGNIFGTAIAKCLDFEIENIVNLEGQEVEYQTGIIVDGITQWISLGNFIIQDVEPNDTTNIARVTAMDYMLKTNILYESSLDYDSNQITILQVLQEACTKSGLELATIEFSNSNFIVDSNQFAEGTLNRQVIQAVAAISGTVAKIKSDNRLYLINPNQNTTVSKIFTLNNYKEAEIKRATHPINLVSLGMSQVEGENITLRDETSIAENGENSLVINDNPFAYTQAKREQLIIALFNVVKGFEYKAFSFKCQGLPYSETMDKIRFLDKEGNTYDSYVFRFNYKSPNGLESTIEAPSIIKATVNYQNVPSALEIAKRTEIIVNKQEQKITSLAQETTENSRKITKQEQDIDSIKSTVQNVVEVTSTIDGLKKVILDNCVAGDLLELHIYGNNTVFDYLYPSDDLYPNDKLYPYGDSRIELIHFPENSEEGTSKIYELGITEVLRQNEEVQDEYVLENGQAKIIRRVAKDGTTLAEEIVEEIGSYNIPLEAGTNIINIKNYTANIRAKFALKNSYTDIFATKVEMDAKIELQSENINIELSKKTDSNKIIASINMSTEKAEDGSIMKLLADKISLVGKVLNLAENMSIVSENFNVDSKGNMECSNALITGGKIYLKSKNGSSEFYIRDENNPSQELGVSASGYTIFSRDGADEFRVVCEDGNVSIYLMSDGYGEASHTGISSKGIETPLLTQTSLESIKKNIEKFNIDAIEIIKDAEIYVYNLKSEADTDKKHIGFVIGDKYKTPQEVISKTGKGIDTYSMASLILVALKQEIVNRDAEINELKSRLDKLEKGEK